MKITGYCPMGCGQTLRAIEVHVVAEGVIEVHIGCESPGCANPNKVHDLLQDQETEHIVEFGEDSYNTQHPLRERGTDLFECRLHNEIAEWFDGPPVEPGRYRVTRRPHDPTSESFRSDAHPFEFEPVEKPPW